MLRPPKGRPQQILSANAAQDDAFDNQHIQQPEILPASQTGVAETTHGEKTTVTIVAKTQKAAGELAELHFVLKASNLGFCVSKPYGDSQPYDFILETDGKLQRVQVRSARRMKNGSYRIHAWRGATLRRPFEETEIDALVAFVIPEDAWYIFPVEVVKAMKDGIWLFPQVYRSRSRFEKYREAWHLLRPEVVAAPAKAG